MFDHMTKLSEARFLASLLTQLVCIVLILTPNVATAQKCSDVSVGGAPTIDGASSESVLLRYKFVKGQKVRTEFEISVDLDAGGLVMKMPITMTADYVIKDVNDRKEVSATLTITRMTMQVHAMGEVITFDSDKDQSNPDFREVMAMIDVPIAVRVTDRGELIDMDFSGVLEKMGGIDNMGLQEQANQLLEGSFVQLPENPVKVGDVYDAGMVSRGSVGMQMEAAAQYKIAAVSKDRSKVLLEPIIKFRTDVGQDFQITENVSKGWLLFDVDQGNIYESELVMCIVMKMGQDEALMHLLTKYHAKDL